MSVQEILGTPVTKWKWKECQEIIDSSEATPEQKEVIYRQIQDVAGVDFKKALPKTLIEEKDLDSLADKAEKGWLKHRKQKYIEFKKKINK